MTIKTLYYISTFGLLSSILVHLSTFLGINIQSVFPQIWLFHILIFAVWIPIVLLHRNFWKKNKIKNLWKSMTAHAPRWMKIMTLLIFIYAFFNFFFTIFVLNKGGMPAEIDGQKVLQDHGRIISELTDEQYEKHQAFNVRTFSGHWIIFYAVGMTVLASGIKKENI